MSDKLPFVVKSIETQTYLIRPLTFELTKNEAKDLLDKFIKQKNSENKFIDYPFKIQLFDNIIELPNAKLDLSTINLTENPKNLFKKINSLQDDEGIKVYAY